MRFVVFLILLTIPAAADERKPFYGTWGTAKQCAGAPIKQGGTVAAEPFVIDAEWLKHGQIWCRLTWFPVEQRGKDTFTGARAQCGEDSVRAYVLNMNLNNGELTLQWDFPLSNGPLARCLTH